MNCRPQSILHKAKSHPSPLANEPFSCGCVTEHGSYLNDGNYFLLFFSLGAKQLEVVSGGRVK
jgi:hypothetical protein